MPPLEQYWEEPTSPRKRALPQPKCTNRASYEQEHQPDERGQIYHNEDTVPRGNRRYVDPTINTTAGTLEWER